MTVRCPCCGKEFSVVLTTQAPTAPAAPIYPPDALPGYENHRYEPWRAHVAIQAGGCCDGATSEPREGAD